MKKLDTVRGLAKATPVEKANLAKELLLEVVLDTGLDSANDAILEIDKLLKILNR